MEPLKRGLSLFNFCYILYILLRVRHSCLNSRYFRNSHRDWNSTLYARVHCLQGMSFITKIHLQICVELRCGRSEALDFRLCWSFWLHSYKKPPLWGLLKDAWASHNLLQILCSSPVKRAQGVVAGYMYCKVNIYHPGQRYIYIYLYICINPSVSSLCPQPLPVLKLIH